MLDFETCQECCRVHGLPFSSAVEGWADIKHFYCPNKYVLSDWHERGYISYKQTPPEWCPNALEHIVLEAANA